MKEKRMQGPEIEPSGSKANQDILLKRLFARREGI
jgi:hypothetical protein